MAGRKLFTNKSGYAMSVTLMIRASEDPRHQAGTKEFWLDAGQSAWQEYGNNIDIYLNGFGLQAVENGAIRAEQSIVIVRGSPLDNELNMFNAVDFNLTNNGMFLVSTRQV